MAKNRRLVDPSWKLQRSLLHLQQERLVRGNIPAATAIALAPQVQDAAVLYLSVGFRL
jgi:hypothetical protein